MKRDKVWCWFEDKWNPAVRETATFDRYMFLETLETHCFPVSDVTKVEPKDLSVRTVQGGTKLEVIFTRRIEVTDVQKITKSSLDHIDKGDLWEELEGKMQVVCTVTAVIGYDNTHVCNVCEEYSTSDTTIDCKCCGENAWERFEDFEYFNIRKVGDVVEF